MNGMEDPRELGDPGLASFQLEKYPFYLLNRVVSRYNAVIQSRLRTIDIDIPAWRVLMILGEREPRRMTEIAEAAVINISTMTRIIQRMARAGLLDCRTTSDDARVTEVQLTPQGHEKLEYARDITAPVYANVIRGFSKRQFEQLIISLNRLHRNLA